MKKFLSLFLALLLLFSLSVPALADEIDGDSDGSAESVSPSPSSDPAPDTDSSLSPNPGPDIDPIPSPSPEPDPDPGPAPLEGGENNVPVENPPLDVADPGLSSVAGDLGELPFDVIEVPNGDIIIEEHSYTRTVDIQDASVFDDLPTMRSVVVSIFGEYTPKTQSVTTYYDGQLMDSSTEYVPGIAGMDMEWIAGFVIFTVLLYCLMKLLGGIVK